MTCSALLLKWKYWRKYRRLKKKFRLESHTHHEEVLRYEAKIASQRAFYEKRLAMALKRAELREDALTDRVLQAFSLMGVGHSTIDLDKKILLPPGEEEELAPQSSSYILSTDQDEFVSSYKDNFFQMGLEAGKSASQIELLWKEEYAEKAVDEAVYMVST